MNFQETSKGIPTDDDNDKLYLFVDFKNGIAMKYIVGTWGSLKDAQGIQGLKNCSHYIELPKAPK